jgi:type I restriction enzyme S subunit
MEGQELPVGWSSMELNDAGIWGSGGTPSRKNPRYYENGTIPWLVIGDLNDQAVEEFSTSITELGLINSSAKLIPTGSLLVAMYGSIGKLGITTFPCTTNQAIAFCIPNEELVELRYLFHALANAKPELIAKGQGGAQQNISQGILKEHLIPLSPLNEQRRIAAKLDTTLAAVEACRQRLDDVAAILKRFRQAVLSAATSGELTQGWREENFVDGKWDEGCLHELLSSKPRNGYSPKPADQETPIKSLTLSATTTGRFKPEHFKYIDQSIPVDSHLWLTPGDILIQRANTLEYVGISAIYNGPEKTFIYPDLMMSKRLGGVTARGELCLC